MRKTSTMCGVGCWEVTSAIRCCSHMSTRYCGTVSPLPTTIAASSLVNSRSIERWNSSRGSARRYPISAAPRIWTRNGWIRFMCPTCPIVGRNSFSPTSSRPPPSRPASQTRPSRSRFCSRNVATLTWRIASRPRVGFGSCAAASARGHPMIEQFRDPAGVGGRDELVAKCTVGEHLGQLGQQLQVQIGRLLGNQQHEELRDRLAVRRLERNRRPQAGERADCAGQALDAPVGDRNALPQSGRSELFAGGEARRDAAAREPGASLELPAHRLEKLLLGGDVEVDHDVRPRQEPCDFAHERSPAGLSARVQSAPSVPVPVAGRATAAVSTRWSFCFSLCFSTWRSSLSASASIAAYMSASMLCAWMSLPRTCTFASTRCCSLSTESTTLTSIT